MEKEEKIVKCKSYTLKTENGGWLGQIVLTEDGMFASVTDYGNLSYAWRSFGNDDFRQFLCSINMGYFATKMYGGIAYVSYGKKFEQACNRYAEMILPALQTILLSELENGIQW